MGPETKVGGRGGGSGGSCLLLLVFLVSAIICIKSVSEPEKGSVKRDKIQILLKFVQEIIKKKKGKED